MCKVLELNEKNWNRAIISRNTWQGVSRCCIFAQRTTNSIHLKRIKWQNLFLPFQNWHKCISRVVQLLKTRWDACNAASKDVQNWRHYWLKRAISPTTTVGFRPSNRRWYSNTWATPSPIKPPEWHKKATFHSVICRFFCIHISTCVLIAPKTPFNKFRKNFTIFFQEF